MSQEKLNRMREIAQRIVERSEIDEVEFGESEDGFLRDYVIARAVGSLAGQRFAAWLPIAGQLFRDSEMRNSLEQRTREAWRIYAFSHIHRPSMLIGPKGTLPA